MAVADRHGLPVAICVESAALHKVKLATNTLVQMVIPDAPQNLVGDNAYDSDKLDSELRRYGIELIVPHRMNRKIRPRTCVACDGIADVGRLNGCLRGYKISAGWLFVTNATSGNFLGMLHLGCCLILLRHL